jgi:hypothetical protein
LAQISSSAPYSRKLSAYIPPSMWATCVYSMFIFPVLHLLIHLTDFNRLVDILP